VAHSPQPASGSDDGNRVPHLGGGHQGVPQEAKGEDIDPGVKKKSKITKLSEVRKAKETVDFEKTLRELPDELLNLAARIVTDEMSQRIERRGR
jgi:hypothetical protein